MTLKERTDQNGMTEADYLKTYDPGEFERPSVATDMAIFTVTEEKEDNYRKLSEKKLSILLIQRGVHPYLGFWALPGGFVRPSETTEQTARRELREETGLDQVYMEQLYTFSDPHRDPRTWVMSCSYMALIDSSKVRLQAGDDADNARWFDVSFCLLDEHTEYMRNEASSENIKAVRTQHYELKLSSEDTILHAVIGKEIVRTENDTITEYKIMENNGLAFDHARIIACALERLRGKLEYSNLAFHLMPSEFTLTGLQQVYEVILGKHLLKAAFRRKIAPFVEETDSFTQKEGHRPSRLYRKKWEEF